MSKGFTLVELLAVIVILSALVIIVVASVNPLVKDSKKELTDIQINNIEEAAKLYYIKFGMEELDFLYDNPRDCINISELIASGYIDRDEINNPKNNEEITGSVKVTYKSNNYIYEYQKNACTNYDKGIICERVTSTDVGNIPEGDFEAGDAYNCKVDPDKASYKFYVINTPSEEDEMVELIMERNICEDGTVATDTNTCLVEWYAEEATNIYGPVTAMNYLYNATDTWTNIPNIKINYVDTDGNYSYGYGGILTEGNTTNITKDDVTVTASYTNLKARMASTVDTNSDNYFGDYLSTSTYHSLNNVTGYWLLTSGQGLSESGYYNNMNNPSGLPNSKSYGVRPVINVYKSQFE